ncbi:MAG: hypothetical protein KDD44_08290 [Bdellovibrionales bacterium]|nr:hypothetical protein [Bdellovibrionales bacterium]
MSHSILPTTQPKVLTFDEQVVLQALLLQAMSEAKALLRNPHCRAQLRSQAVKLFNTLGTLDATIDTGDEVLKPAHCLKTQWNEAPLAAS